VTAANYYVHLGNTTGGDGTARILDGADATRAYSTLASCLTARVSGATLTQNMTIHIAGGATGTLDAGGPSVPSHTPGAYTLTIAGDRDADLYPGGAEKGLNPGSQLDTSYPYFQNSGGYNALSIRYDAIADGLQARPRPQNANGMRGILMSFDCTVRNCILQGNDYDNEYGIKVSSASNEDYLIENNIFSHFDLASSTGIHFAALNSGHNNQALTISNNTFFDCYDGVYFSTVSNSTGHTAKFYNNAFANNGTDFTQALNDPGDLTVTSSHNASDDLPSSLDSVGSTGVDMGGLTTTWDDHFTAPNAAVGSRDFLPLSTGDLGAGTTNASVPTLDRLGATRHASVPTIGVFELAAGGGPTPHPAGPFGHPLSGALGGPI
jgi:hypothetical protein